jgi:(p)ppGpp synthase/HD superfamily hydrolase
MIGQAIAITAKAFEDKYDKGGQSYVLHCLRVMNSVDGDEDVKCAAVMHDLIEDTDLYPSDLLSMGFSFKTVDLIFYLTHREGESYEEYIGFIKTHPEATAIKLADLEDNMNILRLKELGHTDLERIAKYHKSYKFLLNKNK